MIVLFDGEQSMSLGMCGMGSPFQAAARQRRQDGIPTQKFRKELAKIGEYIADGQKWMLTQKAFDHWVLQFSRMKKAGVKIPVAVGSHEESIHPDNNRGWLVDLFQEDDSLFMTCKIIGEDAIAMAPRSDVSIYAPPTWADGVGNDYVRPITHVLMVTDSVVPGLGDWVPLAASLSRKKETDMDLEVLGKALGLSLKGAEKPEEMVTGAFEDVKKASDKITTMLEGSEKEVAALKLSLANAGGKEPVEPEPMMVKLVSDNRSMKIESLFKAGRVLPKVREGLERLFIGDSNAAIALSLKSQAEDPFDAVIELFAANDPKELGEKTGPQTLALQNKIKRDPKDNPLLKDAERRTEEHQKRFSLVGAR